MAESPTREQVLIERSDVETYIENNEANLSLDDYISKSLAQVKRDIEDVKGIKWARIYNSADDAPTYPDYFLDVDDEAHNKDRVHNLIILLTVAYVFKDYAINRTDDAVWSSMYMAYRGDYDRSLDEVKLSVDWNDSGVITEDEEEQTTQNFMVR
jgi:hypothetical protein